MALIYWLCYNFVLALLPVPLVAGYLWLKDSPVSLAKVVRNGQLFFYCATVAAATIGDLTSPANHPHLTGAKLGFCIFGLLLCIVVSCWCFGIATDDAGGVSDRRLASTSYIFALVTIVLVSSIRWNLHLY